MIELLVVVLGVAVFIWLVTQTDVFEAIVAFPQKLFESAKREMLGLPADEEEGYSVTDDEGGIRRELPMGVPVTQVKPNELKQEAVWDSTLPMRILNPELANMTISDMPLIYRKRGIPYIL